MHFSIVKIFLLFLLLQEKKIDCNFLLLVKFKNFYSVKREVIPLVMFVQSYRKCLMTYFLATGNYGHIYTSCRVVNQLTGRNQKRFYFLPLGKQPSFSNHVWWGEHLQLNSHRGGKENQTAKVMFHDQLARSSDNAIWMLLHVYILHLLLLGTGLR